MNVPQTIVALLTLASQSEEVTVEMAEQVQLMLQDASRQELAVLVSSLANIQSFSLALLEEKTGMSREGFLRELGLDVAQNEEE